MEAGYLRPRLGDGRLISMGYRSRGRDLRRVKRERVDKLKDLKLIKLKIICSCRYRRATQLRLNIFFWGGGGVSSHTRFKIKASEWHQCLHPRAVLAVEYSWSCTGGGIAVSKMQKKKKKNKNGNYVMQNSHPAPQNYSRICKNQESLWLKLCQQNTTIITGISSNFNQVIFFFFFVISSRHYATFDPHHLHYDNHQHCYHQHW